MLFEKLRWLSIIIHQIDLLYPLEDCKNLRFFGFYCQMESKIVLAYWNIRGLAERIRLLLEYCGLPYTETKYFGDQEEDRNRWNNEVKPVLAKKNPAINLPYLEDGDKLISESDAISVYICYRANRPELMGRTVDQKVAMATAWGVFRDIHIQFVGLCYGHHGFPTFEAARENFPKQIRPFITRLNGLLADNEFIAGEITWIDFAIADFLQALGLFTPVLLTEFPKLKTYQERVWSLPELKDYLSSRFKERPINNYVAIWK